MTKTILVTGAATGFGRGVAFELARKGFHVIAGCQIWPQVWELRQAAQSEDLVMQVIKLDVLDGIDYFLRHLRQQLQHFHGAFF